MTHLRIELNTGLIENVTASTIHKVYLHAKAIIDAEELALVEESQVILKGNLLVTKAQNSELTWLLTKFPDLHINVTVGRYIDFADSNIKTELLTVYGDGVGILPTDISTIYIDKSFTDNTNITSFNELSLFTNVTKITANQFLNCTNLTSIDTSRITNIDSEGLSNTGITSLDLSSIVSIGAGAFANCASLTSLDLSGYNFELFIDGFSNPFNTNSIIKGCTALTTIGVNTINVASLRPGAFCDCQSLAGELNFPNVTSISYNANTNQFKNCYALTKISFGHLQSVPEGNKWLGNGAFQNCTGLKILDLGDSITSVGSNCINGCNSLKAVVIRTTTPPSTFDSTVVLVINDNGGYIYVPSSAVGAYQADSTFSQLTIKSIENDYNESAILAS